MQTRQRTAVLRSCLPPLPALWSLSSGSAHVGVQGVTSCQPLAPGQTLLVPSVFRQCDPRKEDLSWRCPKRLQSTAMESGKIKLADVCRWLRNPPQKGGLATAGSLCSEGGARPWRQKAATPASPILLYLLGFLISVSGNFLLSVLQTQIFNIILDSSLSLSHSTSNPSANPAGSTIRIYPDSDHLSPPPLFPWGPATIVPRVNHCHDLLTSLSDSTLDPPPSILNMAA